MGATVSRFFMVGLCLMSSGVLSSLSYANRCDPDGVNIISVPQDGLEWLVIGEPGNLPDPSVSEAVGVPVGGVSYPYMIMRHELTRGEYVNFLNAVDPDGSNVLRLYHPSTIYLSFFPLITEIDIEFAADNPVGQKYYVNAGKENQPAEISWYAAARFCNWLHNGRGGPGSTEGDAVSGCYDTRNFDDADVSNDPDGHNPGARFWISTDSEWAKAAYFKRGSPDAGYWPVPTGGLTRIIAEPPSGGDHSANISDGSRYQSAGPVPVGSYPNTCSPFGVLDMAGNAEEWTETWHEGRLRDGIYPRTQRIVWGGRFNDNEGTPSISYRFAKQAARPPSTKMGVRFSAPLHHHDPGHGHNQAPVIEQAVAEPAAIADNESTVLRVVASDPDGDALSFNWSSATASGGLSGADGATAVYTPAAVTGSVTETFTIAVADGQAQTQRQLTVTVSSAAPQNRAPQAQGASLATPAGVPLSGVLRATDPDGDALSYRITTQPALGSVVIDYTANGAFTYTPRAGVAGNDSFGFVVNDGQADSHTAVVQVTVNAVNSAPVAQGKSFTVAEGGVLSGRLSATDSDGDGLNYRIVSPPSLGSVVLNDIVNGAFTYTPRAGEFGTDRFSFAANDGQADSNVALVQIDVNAVNTAPVAQGKTVSVTAGGVLTGALTATDADGDSLSFSIVSSPGLGSLALTDAATGAFTYTPQAATEGTDSFSFAVTDGQLTSNVATVQLEVTAAGQPSVIRINFQRAGVPTPPGYRADVGAVYGDRGEGFVYGWNVPNEAQARDRNRTQDQRYDTLNHMQHKGIFHWEMAVPNGTYQVRLVAGDPQYFDGHDYRLLVEDVPAINGRPHSGQRWLEATVNVTVQDGRLTVDNAPGSIQNRICFIEITRL